ncbi:hypothetical protein HK103_002054 [Boothiomyces macroporosus]|uniref:Ankyrin repeat protein n=1 Tax=Boothiomyces macroporosus TaxID=261099 RepID=A0AAD5Y4Y5_9FUNG|nr:hypothetical protein HK103_002054 [Boothiomyces macroporosus]
MFRSIVAETYIISQYLSLVDYHNLRFASIEINLSSYPQLSWQAYVLSSTISHQDISEFMTVSSLSITDEKFMYFVDKRHIQQLSKSFTPQVSFKTVLRVLRNNLYDIHSFQPEIVLELLKHIDLTRISVCEIDRLWHRSIDTCSVEIVELMLERNLLLDLEYGMFTACQEGSYELVDLLISFGVDPSVNDSESLVIACRYGYDKIVQLLLADPRVNPSGKNNQGLVWACKNGNTKIVCGLLHCYNMNATIELKNECFLLAVVRGHDDIVGLLMDDGRIDPYVQSSALLHAAKWGHLAVLELLVQAYKVDLMHFGNLAFTAACANGYYLVVEYMLGIQGIDPNFDGSRPLYLAAQNGHLKVVEILAKDKRVDVSQSVIRSAKKNRHLDIYKILTNRSSTFLCWWNMLVF